MDLFKDLVVAGVISGGSWWLLSYCSNQEHKQQKRLEEVKEARIYTPSQLLADLDDPKDGYLFGRFKRVPGNRDEIHGSIFIQGIANCQYPIKSVMNPNEDLIYSEYSKTAITANEDLGATKLALERRPMFPQRREMSAFIDLTDENEKKKKKPDSVRVHRSMKVNLNGIVTKINARQEVDNLGVAMATISAVTDVAQAVKDTVAPRPGQPKQQSSSAKNIVIGYNEKEWGIRVGGVILVYGDVIYDTKNKKLRIEFPEFLTKAKESVVDQIEGEKGLYKFLTIPLAIILVGALGWAGYRTYKYFSDKKEREAK